jgi:hypothetical protein
VKLNHHVTLNGSCSCCGYETWTVFEIVIWSVIVTWSVSGNLNWRTEIVAYRHRDVYPLPTEFFAP